jgi:flagellar basal-body rod protein FlgB
MVTRHFAGSVPVADCGAIGAHAALHCRFFDERGGELSVDHTKHRKINGKRRLARRLHRSLCFPRVGAGNALDPPSGERRNLMMASEKLFGLHATALQLRSQRMMMLASNIANAATPGYKARDLDFSKALDLAQRGGSTANAIEGAMAYRVPVQASLDGNTVEMATEQTAFAENALAYRSSLSFLSGRVNTLTRAIKGE